MGDYDQLAALLGQYPDLAIFRIFTKLSAKTLLYMQADLVHEEAQLGDLELEDGLSGDPEKSSYRYSWYGLSRSSENGHDDLQLQKVLRIRGKLREYHSSLLQFSQLLRLRSPKDADLRFLREWLERPEFGNNFLQDREADVWEQSKDLIALAGPEATTEKDTFAMWISSACVPWFHRKIGHRIKALQVKPITTDQTESHIWHYPDNFFAHISNIMCTTLSSLLPILSTLVLYHLSDPGARLISFMVFNVLCTFVLAVVVNARRIEVFAVTSAFAAVQVVFVGGVNYCLPSQTASAGGH